LLDLKRQYAAIRDEVQAVLAEVCESQQFVLGSRVQSFEQKTAAYCGVKEAVGLSSGTDALLVALMALGVGPGDTVLTTPYSFFATAGSIARLGARPLFVDIDPATFNLDPAKASRIMADGAARRGLPRPKVLLPVHLFGQCADMDPLLDLAREFSCRVIEDAAQAIGAEYPSRQGPRRAGAMGDIGCFSFFPSKNLGCFGDGGMSVTNDDELASRLRVLRAHGSEVKYYHRIVGGNFRLDALQAAVLEVKLKYLESWHAARRANAAFYDRAFADSPVRTPAAVYRDQGLTNFHIYNQYVVRVPDRDAVRKRLETRGIGCEVYYPVPLHLQECFRELGYQPGDFPESERAARETLALPIFPELDEAMKRAVATAILEAVA
jgi:dTDP-4-amino-4,6-dideoxygalactose transaminase